MWQLLVAAIMVVGLVTVAQAHVPEVGGVRPTPSVCNELAAYDIFNIAEERGLGATSLPAFQYERTKDCRVFYGPIVRVSAVAVMGPVYTPDGYVVYLVRVELMEGILPGGPWYAFHRHKAEEQPI